MSQEPLETALSVSPQNKARYAIGELAEDFGVTLRTLRFYESEGLLSPERVGTTRLYSRKDRARLALICRGKRLGFSISEIREFLELYTVDLFQVEQMAFLLQRARERMATLEAQRKDLETTLGELRDIERRILDHLEHHNPATADHPLPEL